MSKINSKLQVTLPKAIADQLGIRPGDEINWEISGDGMRVTSSRTKKSLNKDDPEIRLRVFDAATRRQRQRDKSFGRSLARTAKDGRGWTREQVYTRGGSDRH